VNAFRRRPDGQDGAGVDTLENTTEKTGENPQ
jgi:hypothetical protein